MGVLHRTYARSLHQAAKEAGRVQVVREELADFAAAVRDVPELRSLLLNPQLEPRAKASALEAILGGSDELLRNFLLLLAAKGRIAGLEEIARDFERIAAADEGQIEVELTTAFALSDDDARSIVSQIEQASGRRVEATRKVDPSLIGGVVLQAGSLRVDASIRGRLNRLRHELVHRT